MRRFTILALALLLALSPALYAGHARAQDAAPAAPAPAASADAGFDYFPLVVGAGAIAGVVGYNLLALGAGALPGGFAYGVAGAVVPAEMSVAMSRVYAVTTAVAGGLLAYYMFAP